MNDVCRTLREDLELYAEGELHVGARERRVRRHLERCTTCRAILEAHDREVRRILALSGEPLRHPGEPDPLAPDSLEPAFFPPDRLGADEEDWLSAEGCDDPKSSRSNLDGLARIERSWARVLAAHSAITGDSSPGASPRAEGERRRARRSRRGQPSGPVLFRAHLRAGGLIAATAVLAATVFLLRASRPDRSVTEARLQPTVERPSGDRELPDDLSGLVWRWTGGDPGIGVDLDRDLATLVSSRRIERRARDARSPVASRPLNATTETTAGPEATENPDATAYVLEIRLEDEPFADERLWLVEEPSAEPGEPVARGICLPVRPVSLGRVEEAFVPGTRDRSRRFRVVHVVGRVRIEDYRLPILSDAELARRQLRLLGGASISWSGEHHWREDRQLTGESPSRSHALFSRDRAY